MNWLADNSSAIQAFSALAIAILTVSLILVTRRYVHATQKMLQIMERDSAERLRPRVIPHISYQWDGQRVNGTLTLENPGDNDAVLREVELEYYCSRSELTQVPPIEFRRLYWRLLPPNKKIHLPFQVCPLSDAVYHDEHEGECEWVFRARVRCRDAMGILNHVYNYDEALGFSYYSESLTVRMDWIRHLASRARNRLRRYRYQLRKWKERIRRT